MYTVNGITMDKSTLVEGKNAKLTYCGSLYNQGAEEIYLHLGFGLLWEDLTEIKMTKADTGFSAEIPLKKADTLNFCFRDNLNNWDNNSYQNYSYDVSKKKHEKVLHEQKPAVATNNISGSINNSSAGIKGKRSSDIVSKVSTISTVPTESIVSESSPISSPASKDSSLHGASAVSSTSKVSSTNSASVVPSTSGVSSTSKLSSTSSINAAPSASITSTTSSTSAASKVSVGSTTISTASSSSNITAKNISDGCSGGSLDTTSKPIEMAFSLVSMGENEFSPFRKLPENYLRNKKMRIMFYRMFAYVPRLLNGYTKKKAKSIFKNNGLFK